MSKLIGFPFRITNAGTVATRQDGSDECYTEELALLCLTKPGERELVPQYGLSDPSFGELNQTELIGKVALFGPEVTIIGIDSSYPTNGEHRLVISYESMVNDNESEESFDG